jgi:hypothetical protein
MSDAALQQQVARIHPRIVVDGLGTRVNQISSSYALIAE